MATLTAWVDGRRAGEFSEQPVADGSLFTFEYSPAATSRDLVSLTMLPESARRFESRIFPPPFDMILPEGERRMRIEAARKILRTDSFSLLSYVGANPVNRVRFLPADEPPTGAVPELPTPLEIADCGDGQALFRRLVRNLDLRQGIAGVQPKVLGASGKAPKLSADVREYRGSTHILKSSTSQYPFLAVNESVCLGVFKEAGLAIPNATLSADGELLLVERFDTCPDGTHLGFEEAAALMGETSATKYQRDYGSLVNALAALVPALAEDKARRDLTQALVLNYLLGNGDAHLKNFGLLYSDEADVQLAPFYDCVATLPYIPDDVPALALSYEWYSKAWWPREKLEDFSRDYGGLSPAETRHVFAASIEAVTKGIAAIGRHRRTLPGFDDLGREIQRRWKGRIEAFRGDRP